MVEMSSISFERDDRPQSALQAVRSSFHRIHTLENFGEDNVQLGIGLFGQLAICCNEVDLLLKAFRQGDVVGRGELAGVDTPERSRHRAAHLVDIG